MGDTADTTAPDTTTQDSNEPVVDYAELLLKQQEALQQTGQTVEELRRELGGSKQVIERVQKAFTNDQEKPVSPYQQKIGQYEELQQYYAQEALKHQRAGGSGMPLTTKAGLELAKLGIESERRAEALESELAKIRQQLDRQNNPNFQGLERAAHIMEGMVSDGLEEMYGADKGSAQIRAAQFDAVTNRINAEIKDLMKNEPETLLKIQRNPKYMRNMVNHFMAEMLPPKVRGMLEDQRIQNTPMDTRELWTAFNEAKAAHEEALKGQDKKKIHDASQWVTSIRQDILASQYGGKRGNPDKPSLNQLMGGGRRG